MCPGRTRGRRARRRVARRPTAGRRYRRSRTRPRAPRAPAAGERGVRGPRARTASGGWDAAVRRLGDVLAEPERRISSGWGPSLAEAISPPSARGGRRRRGIAFGRRRCRNGSPFPRRPWRVRGGGAEREARGYPLFRERRVCRRTTNTEFGGSAVTSLSGELLGGGAAAEGARPRWGWCASASHPERYPARTRAEK